MCDYSGGSISTERAHECIRTLNDRLATEVFSFHPGVSYRHVLMWKNGLKSFEGLETVPPHDITGQAVEPHLPQGPGCGKIRELMEAGRRSLAGRQPGRKGSDTANAIWLWGQGRAPRMPSLAERYGIRGATVCAVDLIKGLGVYAGLRPIGVPGATGDLDTNYRGKVQATLDALQELDFVFLHVEAPDEAGHRGDLREKIEAIEMLDAEVVGPLCEGLDGMGTPYRLLILPDHPTPIHARTHTDLPVPFAFYAAHESAADLLGGDVLPVSSFDEVEAAGSGFHLVEGHRLVDFLLG